MPHEYPTSFTTTGLLQASQWTDDDAHYCEPTLPKAKLALHPPTQARSSIISVETHTNLTTEAFMQKKWKETSGHLGILKEKWKPLYQGSVSRKHTVAMLRVIRHLSRIQQSNNFYCHWKYNESGDFRLLSWMLWLLPFMAMLLVFYFYWIESMVNKTKCFSGTSRGVSRPIHKYTRGRLHTYTHIQTYRHRNIKHTFVWFIYLFSFEQKCSHHNHGAVVLLWE